MRNGKKNVSTPFTSAHISLESLKYIKMLYYSIPFIQHLFEYYIAKKLLVRYIISKNLSYFFVVMSDAIQRNYHK